MDTLSRTQIIQASTRQNPIGQSCQIRDKIFFHHSTEKAESLRRLLHFKITSNITFQEAIVFLSISPQMQAAILGVSTFVVPLSVISSNTLVASSTNPHLECNPLSDEPTNPFELNPDFKASP